MRFWVAKEGKGRCRDFRDVEEILIQEADLWIFLLKPKCRMLNFFCEVSSIKVLSFFALPVIVPFDCTWQKCNKGAFHVYFITQYKSLKQVVHFKKATMVMNSLFHFQNLIHGPKSEGLRLRIWSRNP